MTSEGDAKGSGEVELENEQSANPAVLPVWAPRCIYFYYLVPHNQNHADVNCFIYDRNQVLNDATVDGLIPGFLAQAQGGAYANLTPVGSFFEDITWVRQSYLVIMVDPSYTLQNIRIWDSSHTLFNRRPLNIGSATGVRYHNYIVRRGGQTWNRDKREKEQLWIEIEFRARSSKMGLQIASHDDSGTNMGPPVPPP